METEIANITITNSDLFSASGSLFALFVVVVLMVGLIIGFVFLMPLYFSALTVFFLILLVLGMAAIILLILSSVFHFLWGLSSSFFGVFV